MMKRMVSWILCVALLISCCAMAAAAAPATMTDEEKAAVLQQRRDIAEAHMRKICSLVWRCDVDVHYNRVPSVLPEDAEKSIRLVAGRLYRGLPYSYSGGSYETFMMLTSEPDEQGIRHVSDLNWQMLSGGSANGRFGTDCSGSVCQSWSQVANSFTFQTTGLMAPKYGFLRVGEYTSSNNTVNDDYVPKNGEQVMYKAYSQLQKADALVHDGHVRMAVKANTVYNDDGTINGEESTITFLEQTTTWINKNDSYYDETLGETVYNICGVDITYTFKQFYDGNYVPVTCKEFVDPSTVEAPVVTDSLAKAEYGYETLLEGEITTNNWTMDYLRMTITDDKGNTVQESTAAALRNSTSGNNRYKFLVRQFDTEYREKLLGYIAPHALAAGNYHCKLVCRLSNGMEFTVRDFDFTVGLASNDVHKVKIDFAQGTVHDCPMCGEKNAQWQPLTEDHVGADNGPKDGHFYLTGDLNNTTYIPITDTKICLHLNGHNVTSTERAFHVGSGATFNIMGEGVVTGTYTSTETRGVAMDVSNSTVNIFGGEYRHLKASAQRAIIGLRDSAKVRFFDGASIVGNSNSVRSSVLVYKGRFEMYGGVVEEGYGSNGGNFLIGYTRNFSPSYLVVYGGTIRNGHSSGANGGGNIYGVYDSYIYIRGGNIYGGQAKYGGNIAVHKSANAVITGGTITGGTASVQGNNIYANNLEDVKLGECMLDAGIRIRGDAVVEGEIEYNAEKNAFLLIGNGTSLVKNGLTAARYPTLAEAVAAYSGADYLRLYDDQDLTLPEGTWKVDLNGQKVAFTTEGALAVSGDGGKTFSPVTMGLTHINLRPTSGGIYYTGTWNCPAAKTTGVALSLQEMPRGDFATDGHSLYTVDSGNSVLVDDILGTGNDAKRAAMPIYGAAYMTFADGSALVTGETVAWSLKQTVKYLAQNDIPGGAAALETFKTSWPSLAASWKLS